MHLVQFELGNGERRVGLVDGALVREVQGATSTRELALAAIDKKISLAEQVDSLGLGDSHDYSQLRADLMILPPLDHPRSGALLVSGTGLTHLGSASARDKMHQHGNQIESGMTDTMQHLQMGHRRRQTCAGPGRCAAGVVLQR